MPNLRLMENERYIRHCESRHYMGRHHSLGYLFLTNQRLVYHRINRIFMFAAAAAAFAAILFIFRYILGYLFGLAHLAGSGKIIGYILDLAYFAGLATYTIFRNATYGRFEFDIPLQDIGGVERGTMGRKKDILIVTRKDGTQMRLSVDNKSFWDSDIGEAIEKCST